MRRYKKSFAYVVSVIGLSGCHSLLSAPDLSAGQQDPAVYDTPNGAEQQATGALARFRHAAGIAVLFPMTDELQQVPDALADQKNPGDQRVDPVNNTNLNPDELYHARLSANLAQAALAKYASATPTALRAEVLASEGYAELFLADEYCSGIPLSTVDFEGTFTYDAPRSTVEVYQHAAGLFATAIPLAAARDSVVTLATVGLARALVGEGLYDSAAHVVAAVPTTSVYAVRRRAGMLDFTGTAVFGAGLLSGFTIGDREGGRGLPYRSSLDPRIVVQAGTSPNGSWTTQLLAADFASDSVVVLLASGIEARLIEAEAQLQPADAPSGNWLATLNMLRATVGLRDTTDPGTARGRVDLLFRERAFWLFLDGQRQGDMRRLIRQYHRRQDEIYPTGPYPVRGVSYGSAVNLPIRDDGNPLFHGCLNRGA